MATTADSITVADFIFYNNFDSANLAKVEQVNAQDIVDQGNFCDINIMPCISLLTSLCHDDNIDFFVPDVGEAIVNKSNKVPEDQQPEYEFNVWTKHDCHGTEFQNNNRTWFYFGIKSPAQGIVVKFNVINLNRQSKMFSQGMCPVFKVIPGHPHWERIRDKPTYTVSNLFQISKNLNFNAFNCNLKIKILICINYFLDGPKRQ